MKHRLKYVNALILSLFSISASAGVIDFEASGTPNNFNALDYAIDGFVFNATMDNIDISSGSSWGNRGPAHSGSFVAVNNYGGVGEMHRADSATFSIENLWLKPWFSVAGSATVTGLLNGLVVGAVTNNFPINGWTQFSLNWAKVDQVQISSSTAYFVLDDITVNSVPEPATYSMLLAGLALTGLAVRGKRRS